MRVSPQRREGAIGLPTGVWWIAFAKAALVLGTTRFGFHRDEFYFIEASKHIQTSYVDFQPVVPVLVRIERFFFGDWIYGLRLIPALAGVLVVVLGALIAREFGGSKRAMLFAAFALAVVPLFLGMTATLNTVTLETPAWMFVTLVFVRLVGRDDPKVWPLLGFAIGLGLLVKFTELAYIAGLVVAVLVSPSRKHLRTIWPYLGVLITVAMIAPSIAWQASHHWAVVEFVRHQGGGGAVLGLRGRAGYLVSLVILPGPLALWLTVPGVRKLLQDRTIRTVGLAQIIALAGLLVASGKGYYAAPGIAVIVIAGAVALAMRDRSLRPVTVALVVNLLIPLPLLLPLVPVSALRSSTDIAQATELSERIGWPDLAANVSRVYRSLPRAEQRRAIAIGSNYTIPAVLDFYAKRYPVPPAGSGHNSAYLWPPPARPDHVAITIGIDRSNVRKLYRDVTFAGRYRNRDGVEGYDWDDPIYIARGPRYSFEREWKLLKNFTA